MADTLSTLLDLYREEYDGDMVMNVAYQKAILWKGLKKISLAGQRNKYYKFPLVLEGQQGFSALSTTAAGNSATTTTLAWEVPSVINFAQSNFALDAFVTSGDLNAVYSNIRLLTDMAIEGLSERLDIQLLGNRGGSRGIISGSPAAGTSITLADAGDAQKFHLGQVLQAVNGSTYFDFVNGSLRSGSVTVSGIDVIGGVLTVSTVPGTWVDADNLVVSGDYLGTTGSNGSAAGLADWCPSAEDVTAGYDLSADFYGVTARSTYPARLSGSSISASGLPIAEALNRLTAAQVANGGAPDTCLLSPDNFATFVQETNNTAPMNAVRVSGSKASIGLDAFEWVGQRGKIKVIPNRFMSSNILRTLKMDQFQLVHWMDDPIKFVEFNGTRFYTISGQFNYFFQMYSTCNYFCEDPRSLGVATLA